VADTPDPRPTADESEAQEWLRPIAHLGVGRRASAKRVGGKAASLARLVHAGFLVPQGWVIDAKRFAEAVAPVLPKNHDLPSLLKIATTPLGVDRSARARERILTMELPAGLLRAIEGLWRATENEAPWGLAVRSSATCEDREETSLAGLAVTVLGARGPDAIAQAIKDVWASAFLPRALAYLAKTGVRDLGMAVVLQRMVKAEAAGVVFTAPPPGLASDAWRQEERLVNATLGLGAPVVDGAAPFDAFRIAKSTGLSAGVSIGDKRRALIVGAHGIEETAVPMERALRPCLDAESLRSIADLADRLEQHTKGACDFEFAIEERPRESAKLWLLQARPLTGEGFPDGGDANTVWSRANVGEALPGAATPLTWSVAKAFSEKGFRDAFGALGCKVPKGAVLVGNIYGRFYLNLSTFMQIAGQVPGLSPRALLGQSGGASEAAIRALEASVTDISHRNFLLRLPMTGPRELMRQAGLEREVEAYEQGADRDRRVLSDLDLSLLPDDALATTLGRARTLLDRTGGLMLACASASLAAHLALVRVLERVMRKKSARATSTESEALNATTDMNVGPIAQALVGGVRELDSANPGLALARVADIARGDLPAASKLARGEAHRVEDLPMGPARRAVERFLEDFGDRAVREAELSTPRWREDPSNVLQMLASSLRATAGDPEQALARARSLADREMARLEGRLNMLELAGVRALIERTQRFTRLRERMRTWVTRVLGLFRRIALDVDRRLVRIDPSLPAGSVFFCTYDELVASLRSGRAEIGPVVRLRRAEYARDAARPDPPPVFIGRPSSVSLPPVTGSALYGLPASGGVVEGRARVLPPGGLGLDEVEPGEILVSRTTDVGLSPLFLVASAVVTELGGPLSHAAIVAREYGIPAVVNVPGATIAIKNGDRLRVDGDRGLVERLDEKPPPSRRSYVPPPMPRGSES
jgi:pyruvate,water dikinase